MSQKKYWKGSMTATEQVKKKENEEKGPKVLVAAVQNLMGPSLDWQC